LIISFEAQPIEKQDANTKSLDPSGIVIVGNSVSAPTILTTKLSTIVYKNFISNVSSGFSAFFLKYGSTVLHRQPKNNATNAIISISIFPPT